MAVTRDAVARRANVSTAVVSYVINNGPRPVSEKTRARVLAAIEELGYRPDRAAQQLASGKSHTIGFVLPDIESPYMAEVTQILAGSAFGRGYELLIATNGGDLDRERAHLVNLAERRADGVILMPVDPTPANLEWAASLGLPVLAIDRPAIANRRTVAATEHLVRHGHRRIGIITGQRDRIATRRRRDAWAKTLRAQGLEVDRELIMYADPQREGGYDAACRLFDMDAPPTAVVVHTDGQAFGVLRAAADRNVVIPDDMAIISTEGSAATAFAVPSITVVAQPVGVLAEEALEAILAMARGETGRVTNLEYVVHGRESCGCDRQPV